MFAQIITENGVKKIQPLTADVGAGAPVGSLAMMYKKSAPSGYLYCDGSTFNAATYPALYAYLGSNVLPDYDTSRQSGEPYSYIKATSGLAENQQENVLATINENNSYSTTEQPTGAKWIDGKPIYRKVVDFGALPNNDTKYVAHNIANIDNITDISIIAKNTSEFLIIATGKNSVTDFNAWITTTNINIHTDLDRTAFRAYVTLEYTKTTD